MLVYCGAHADQVEAYLTTSRWKTPSPTSPFASLTLLRTPAASVGDALRDLDKRDLIIGDFLLVHGDVVSNMLIEPALLRHKARREKDKSAIMTMIVREGRPRVRKRDRRGRPVFVVGPGDRCLHYEELGAESKHVNIEPDILSANPESDIRTDLRDPRIDICAPDVLSLWSDNFDYQAPRAGFLSGVLRDYELNGKTIHVDVAKQGYAARVKDVRSYGTVARDIVGRRAYPFAPDTNFGEGQRYRRQRGNIYVEPGIVLGRCDSAERENGAGAAAFGGSKGIPIRLKNPSSPEAPSDGVATASKGRRLNDTDSPPHGGTSAYPSVNASFASTVIVDNNTAIGQGTSIGPGSKISNSCIGRHCRVGRNATITNSHLWDGACVGDGCTVAFSIIGDGAMVGHGSTLDDVRVSSNAAIGDGQKLSRLTDLSEPAAPSVPIPTSAQDDLDFLRPLSRASSTTSLSSISTLASRSSSPSPTRLHRRTSSQVSVSSNPPVDATARATPTAPRPSAASAAATPSPSGARALLADAAASVQDGATRGQPPETVRLELLGQRLSGDADDALVRDALALGLVRAAWTLIDPPPASATAAAAGGDAASGDDSDDDDMAEGAGAPGAPVPAKEAVARVFDAYGSLLRQMGVFDREAESKRDQVAVLRALESECMGREAGPKVLFFALQKLYEDEVVQEEGVMQWWEEGGQEKGKNGTAEVRTLVATFVTWLREAEEEDEDEDDDEEDE